jgi:hypothetical protein
MEPICLQGRTLSRDDLTELRALIAQHSEWYRTALSRHLCELWNWRNGAGRLKDIILCKPARAKGRRFYGTTNSPPEQVRRGDCRARWQQARIFHGGGYRAVRFQELTPSYWQGGARKRPVRLLVVAPVGYRTSKNGRQ